MPYTCEDCGNVIHDDVTDHALVYHGPEQFACASHDAIGCSLCGTYM